VAVCALAVAATPAAGTPKEPQRLTGYSPNKERELHPLHSHTSVSLEVENTSRLTVGVHWLTFDGRRRHYRTLAPRESWTVQTFQSHPWVITSAEGEALACFVVGKRDCRFVFDGQPQRRSRRRPRLPERVDNSNRKYSPPILQQVNNTCSQQAGIHSILTYELNYARNRDGSQPANQLSGYAAWRLLNAGRDVGSEVTDGWLLARFMGIPSVAQVKGIPDDDTRTWLSGYESYYQAMHNRLKSFTFTRLTTADELVAAKRWLYHHDDPELSVGGLLACDAQPDGTDMVQIPEGEYEAGKSLVLSWGSRGSGHLMTYVGYDDRVGYDVNGDGRITTKVDITGDGKVTLADWERGAFILTNSWGTRWGDRGQAYVLYRHCALTEFDRGQWVGRVEVDADASPSLTLRVKLDLDDRSTFWLRVGVRAPGSSSLVASVEPELFSRRARVANQPESPEKYSSFGRADRALGSLPYEGEMGFDLSALREHLAEKGAQIVFACGRHDGSRGGGRVLQASLLRYDDRRLTGTQTLIAAPRPWGAKPLEVVVENAPADWR
jgi:hypothetical protein